MYTVLHVSGVRGLREVIHGCLHMEPFILDGRLCLVFTLLRASAEEGETIFCALLPAGP